MTNFHNHSSGLALIAIVAAMVSANPARADDPRHVCSSCHGMNGRSVSPIFPNLAGQQKDYLVAQLTAFHDKTRADKGAKAFMYGMAARLDGATIDALADYYASQSPAAAVPADGAEAAIGEQIFKAGIDSRSVPACAACHGDQAEGAAAVPRLASQHPDYLVKELRAFQSGTRANDTMYEVAANLTPAEIDGLAAYLAAQR